MRELPESQSEERLIENLQQYGIISNGSAELNEEQRNLKKMFQRRVTAVKGIGYPTNFLTDDWFD